MLSAVIMLSSVLSAPDLSEVTKEYACEAGEIVIVTNAVARMPVVYAGGREEAWAAKYLAATIRDITGVWPGVMELKAGMKFERPALRIERKEDTDDFGVVTKGGSVRFFGRSDYAVYDWCERLLGVRYYLPDRKMTGKTVEKRRNLSVAKVRYYDRAKFNYRDNWPFTRESFSRTLKVGGTCHDQVSVHSPHRWYKDAEIQKNHPNIFAALPSGAKGETPLLCYGNPETLEYYKHRIDEHIAGVRDSGGIVNTNTHVITVSQWDCRLECTCEHCRKMFDAKAGASGSGSPIIWGWFLKQLAKWAKVVHPEYKIAFLPYLNTCDVPKGLDLTAEGNCVAMLCTMPGLGMFKDERVREHEERLIREWARVTGRKVVNWHYGCWPRDYTSAPYLFGREIVEHYQRMQDYEVGSFINGGAGSAAEQVSNYVWMKALWNPDFDVGAVYDEFCRRMFGAAARTMRTLMSVQENGWRRKWEVPVVSRHNVFDVSYPRSTTRVMRSLLVEAAELTKDDAMANARVRWYAADFRKFFDDEEEYRSGRSFEPLKVGEARELNDAFDAERKLKCRTTVLMTTDDLTREMVLSIASRGAGDKDTLEVFWAAGTGTTYRLAFDARGRMSVGAGDREWDGAGVRSKSNRTKDLWHLEVRVKLATVDEGRDLRGNIVRWHPGERGEREWSRLSSLGGKWNQDRDAFSEFDILYKKEVN